MGRPRPKKRPPTPSEAGVDEEEALMLPVGAEVEVRSDEPGFEGSFYEATVAGHLISRRRRRRYTLAYSTLLAEEGGPLKGIADAADVRPRPPPPPPREENAGAAPRGFAICEMVEAFHSDGWWAGVVSAVPTPPVTGDRPRGVYEVTFPTSRETMEFEETALRPHRVFLDGRWVPAAEVDNGSPLFSEGSQVEVCRSERNSGESWSPATVLRVIGAHFLVQYIHIEKNEELGTEVVDSEYIRPACIISRMTSRYRFSPSSHIEVLHQGSWWPGVIVEVLGSGIDKKYVVELKDHETNIEHVDCAGVLTVENTQLRPRYCWDGKKWVRYFEEKPAKGSRFTARKRPISASFALHDEGDGSCRDKKLKKVDVTSCEKKLKKADVVPESISPLMSVSEKCKINHMSSYPEETMEQRNAVLALACQLPLPSVPPMTALGHLNPSSVGPSCHLERSSSRMTIIPSMPQGAFLGTRSHHSDWPNIVLTDQEKQSTVGSGTDLSIQKEECVPFQTPDAPGESTETTKEGIAAKTTEEDTNISAIFEGLAQLPNHMLGGCGIRSELNRGSCIDLTPRKDTRGSQESSEIHDLQQGGYAGETSVEQDTGEDLCKRYLVMPDGANLHFSPSERSREATVHDGQLCMDNATTAMAECMTGSVAPAEDLCTVYPATLNSAMPNPLQLAAKFEITESHTEVFSASSQSIEKSTVTQLSSVGMDNCAETEPGNSLAIIKYVEGTLMSKYVGRRTHDSRCPLLPDALDVHESIIDTNGGLSESLTIQHLPFVKTSPIWAELEALEIFSKVPQRPNFHLVQQYCPELREGMALGLMVSFASLAEAINMMEIQDDTGPFEQKMLGLSLLEANGFDVRDMRSRLDTLLDTRNRRVELQDTMRKLGEKIAHKETDDRELSVEIRMIATALHHLELHACVMRDIMRSAISRKVNNAMEISRLKTEENKLERSYVSTTVPL